MEVVHSKLLMKATLSYYNSFKNPLPCKIKSFEVKLRSVFIGCTDGCELSYRDVELLKQTQQSL